MGNTAAKHTVEGHIGHMFSSGMPEIKSVKGLPLADIIEDEVGDAKGISDEKFAVAFEMKLHTFSEDDIEVHEDLLHFIPEGMTPKEHLVDSFCQFYFQYT